MEAIKGYTVLTNTISGWELAWHTIDTSGEDDVIMPEVFETERAAQLALIEDIEEHIRQFKDKERQWDEIMWPEEYTIARIQIDEAGTLKVWTYGLPVEEHIVIETTVEKWRNEL